MEKQHTEPLKKTKNHYAIETKSLILEPYKRKYVPEYHTWFDKYAELLHLTGSEALTLEEELENHKTWLEDTEKYTFLVFVKRAENEENLMIGDANLFFSNWIEKNEAEVNIMIAVPEFRGKGLAKEIMEVLELFSIAIYQRNRFIAKIKNDNEGSIKFFEKIGYDFIQDNHHHGEKEYHKTIEISKEEALLKLQKTFNLHEINDLNSLFY